MIKTKTETEEIEGPRFNLLNNLYNYRPREKLTSKENFLTEAYAEFLRTNPKFIPELYNSTNTNCIIETQVGLSKNVGIPDLLIYDENHNLIVVSEHKLDSSLDLGQLKRYQKHIEKEGYNAHLYYISRDRSPESEFRDLDTNNFCKMTWSEVFKKIKENDDLIESEIGQYIYENLVNLGEVIGIMPHKPLKEEDIDVFREYLERWHSILSIMEYAKDKLIGDPEIEDLISLSKRGGDVEYMYYKVTVNDLEGDKVRICFDFSDEHFCPNVWISDDFYNLYGKKLDGYVSWAGEYIGQYKPLDWSELEKGKDDIEKQKDIVTNFFKEELQKIIDSL